VIVDDEPWARRRIAALLKSEPDVEVAGECRGGVEAIEKIPELSPDLVFLDVQMPECDGFDVLEAIGPERMPPVIFATAYDKYAVRAFDAQALDYLLKPFDEERFQQAMGRARKELKLGKGASEALRAVLEAVRGQSKFLKRLAVKSGGRVVFLRAADIDWIEAAGNYVTLHVGRDRHMLRATMNSLEPKLDSEEFVRIHRSTIVNLDRVKEMHPWFHGEQVVILKDGTQLPVGRVYRNRLHEYAGGGQV